VVGFFFLDFFFGVPSLISSAGASLVLRCRFLTMGLVACLIEYMPLLFGLANMCAVGVVSFLIRARLPRNGEGIASEPTDEYELDLDRTRVGVVPGVFPGVFARLPFLLNDLIS
jgi:hypothetical protein